MELKRIKQALNSDEGLVILEFLSDYCGEKDRSFVADNTHLTAFNEGKRAVYLDLMKTKDKKIAEDVNKNIYKVTI